MNLSRLPVDVAAQVLEFDGRLRWDGRRGKLMWSRTNPVLDRVLSRVTQVTKRISHNYDQITHTAWTITKTWKTGVISTELARLRIDTWSDGYQWYLFYVERILDPESKLYCRSGVRDYITPYFRISARGFDCSEECNTYTC